MLVKEFKDGQWKVIDNGFGTYYADNQTRGMLKADGDTITTNNGVITCQKQKYAFNTELQYIYPGTYQWQVPDGVEFIKVLVIGGGSNGTNYHAVGSTENNIYAKGAGAISALLKVTPKETIELEVGTNADGVYLWDGRINGKDYKNKTNQQKGSTAKFGDWIEAPSGGDLINNSQLLERPTCTFKPRNTKYDTIINGFEWDTDLAGNRIGKIATSINTVQVAGTNFDQGRYWRTLKAVCDNYQETMNDIYNDLDPVFNLHWRYKDVSLTPQDGLILGQSIGLINSIQAGKAYGLFGVGGAANRTSTKNTNSGGDAVNFGGVGGLAAGASISNYSATGSGGPGGIFIWY